MATLQKDTQKVYVLELGSGKKNSPYKSKKSKKIIRFNMSKSVDFGQSIEEEIYQDDSDDYGQERIGLHLPPIQDKNHDLFNNKSHQKQTRRYKSLIKNGKAPPNKDPKVMISEYFKNKKLDQRNNTNERSFDFSPSEAKVGKLLNKAKRVITKYKSIDLREASSATSKLESANLEEDNDYGDSHNSSYLKRKQLQYYLRIKEKITRRNTLREAESNSKRSSIMFEKTDEESSSNKSTHTNNQETIQEVDSTAFSPKSAQYKRDADRVKLLNEIISPSGIQPPRLDVKRIKLLNDKRNKKTKAKKYNSIAEGKIKMK